MDTQLTTDVQGWTPEQTNLIRSMFGRDLSNDELQLFLYTAKRTGLDPLARQIYAVKRGGRLTIQTGIDGYRLIADRTGRLAGISDYSYDSEDNKFPKRASVTVRKVVEGSIAKFPATARWEEYNAGGPMWQKMPYLMLGKCAEALALRKAFPADLSGVYTAEEMAQADSEPERKAVEAEVQRQKQVYAPKPDAEFSNEPDPVYVPPELDWMYQAKSGVLICRVMSVALRKKKVGDDEYLTIGLNNQINGKALATYFHASHRDELAAAKGKVCKFIVSESGKFINIDQVLEVDGQTFANIDPEGDPEVKARLLASTLEFSEGDLKVLLVQSLGEWAEVLNRLEQMQAEKDEVPEAVAQ